MATNPIGAGSGGYVLYVAKEATWGTRSSTPGDYTKLPAEPLSGLDNVEAITDDLRRGQNIIGYNRMEGVHGTELTISTLSYPDQIGQFLVSLFGQDTNTGSGPYTHIFDVISDASTAATPSLTVGLVDDVLAVSGTNQVFHEGCKVTNLTFRFTTAEGFLTTEATLLGKGATQSNTPNLATATGEPSDNDPLRGWEGFVTNVGGELNGKVTEAEVTVAREADVIYAAGTAASANNKFADAVIHGMVGITGRVVAVFDNTAQVDLYRNLSADNLIVQFDNNAGGASKRNIKFDIKKATYGESPAEIDRSGNHMTIAYSFRGLFDSVSSKGITVTLINGHSASYD